MVVSAARAVCRGALCTVLPHPSNAYRPYAFRHPFLAFLNALFIVATLGSSLVLSLTPEVARLSTIATPTIVRLTNAERAKAGLAALKENPLLQRSAQLKGEHMLRHDYFEHTSPDGLTPWVWFDRANYRYAYAGENLAIDFSEAEDVVAAWMRSASHRRNLLSDRYEEVGIAVVTGEFQGRTAAIVVHHLGARRALPTTASGPAKPPAVTQAAARSTAPSPLAAPRIVEPRPGSTIGGGAATVRGTAPAGSTVSVALDGDRVGTYQAAKNAFGGTFPPPANQERNAVLTATALLGERESPPSAPVPIRLDTKAPAILAEQALMLPDPLGVPRTVLIAVPVTPEIASITVEGTGAETRPLVRQGTIASVRLALETEHPLRLRVTDAHGNTQTVTLQSFLPYLTAEGAPEASRTQVAAAASRLRPALVFLLAVFASLLGVNMLVHLRLHRMLHADLLAHAAFVLSLGTTLVFFA